MKVYPLADAAAPKPTRYVDGFPKPYHSLPAYDASWFRELAAMVNEEPVRERDKVMMGMLVSIGIERGRPFQPDAKTAEGARLSARRRATDNAAVFCDFRPGALPLVARQSVDGIFTEDA